MELKFLKVGKMTGLRSINHRILLLFLILILILLVLAVSNEKSEKLSSAINVTNADTYLNTPTYDGSGQVVHPDIVYFPNGWHGYNYWMAITPYPNGNDSYENPSILASNDGETWEIPSGLTNPIDATPQVGHDCDPDLIYDDITDGLWCYYVECGNSSSYLKMRKSSDGMNWSEEKDIFNLPNYQILSPAIVKVGSTYHMWYVDVGEKGCKAKSTTVKYKTSFDGANWSEFQMVNISIPNRVIWHVDVYPYESHYPMLIAAYPYGSTCGHCDLFYAYSDDKINWNVTSNPILKNSDSKWDNAEIYRSTFVVDRGTFKIWYSARNTMDEWHIGYTEDVNWTYKTKNR